MLGQRVQLIGKSTKGTIRFIGDTKFAPGKWIGLELDEAEGKNNGSVQGEVYFECAENFGMFVKQNQITPIVEKAPTGKAATPTSKAAPSKLPGKAASAPPPKSGLPTKAGSTARPTSTSSVSDSESPATPSSATSGTSAPPSASASRTALAPVSEVPPSPSVPATPSSAAVPVSSAPAPSVTPAAPPPTPLSASSLPLSSASLTSLPTPGETKPFTVFRSVTAGESERVASLEAQAQRDASRIAELEQFRAQALSLTEMKQMWQAREEALLQQLAASQHTKLAERDELEAKILALQQTVELEAMDKEIAEEKYRLLEQQMIELRAATDASQLKTEVTRVEVTPADLANSPPFVELAAQNNRLKAAVFKMKTSYDQLSEECSALNDELNEQRSMVHALKQQLDAKGHALAQAEIFIAQAKEKLANSSDSVVETLRTRNTILEDRLRTLLAEREDLLALVTVDDELEDIATNLDSDSRSKLSIAVSRLTEMSKALEILSKQNDEYRQLILKFREKVSLLEGETSALKGRETELQEEATKLKNLDAKVHNAQANAAHYKERAKNVQKELLELDREQASEHIAVLKRYMPDSLFSLDFDGVRLMLLARRLAAKADIVRNFTREHFRLEEDVARLIAEGELTNDQYAFACDVNEIATFVAVEAGFFLKALEKSKVSTMNGLTSVMGELTGIETGLDQLLKLIVNDGLDPNGSFAELRGATERLHHINNTHLRPLHPPTPSEHLAETMPILAAAAESIVAQLQNFKITVSQGLEGQLEVPTERLLTYLHAIEENSNNLKISARKILRKLPDEKEVTLDFSDEVRAVAAEAAQRTHEANGLIRATVLAIKAHRFGNAVHRTINYEATIQIAAANRLDLTDDGTYTQKALQEGADASLAPMHYFSVVEHALKTVAAVAENLVNGNYDQPAPPPQPKVEAPWDVRAAETRTSLLDTLGLGDQLEARTTELKEARASLRAKEKELAEHLATEDLSKQRTDALKADLQRQAERAQAQAEELKQKLAEKEQELASTIQSLEEEIRAVEDERTEWRRKAEAATSRGRGRRAAASTGNLVAANETIDVLQQALSAVRAECARLRAKELHAQLAELGSLPLPTAGSESVGQALKESGTLIKQAQIVAAQPMVVDITHSGKKAPALQLAARQVTLAGLGRKSRVLQSNASTALASARSSTASALEPLSLVGSVRFPAARPELAHRQALTLNALQLLSVHSSLIAS